MDASNSKTQKKQLDMVKCPVCENNFEIDLSNLEIGDIVECPVCGGTSELVDLVSKTLDPVVKGK